ncbi:uncharacterized protein JCM10292_001955 [Rhodotorula paludigena]|uniref:uncharacterized protein n=1 Tax=Rhodotorula paludigena TaxID=86838 RepID=UPI00316C01D9
MPASSLLLHGLAHTLLLSLFPVLVLQSPRLHRGRQPLAFALLSASTLCVSLYGVCGLVALAGAGAENGRVAGVVAGVMGCLGVVLLDAFALVYLMKTVSRATPRWIEATLGALLTLLLFALASIQVVLLVSEAAQRNLAITRASLHLVFSATITGLYFLAACRTLPETHRRDPELADGPTNTAGAWYDSRMDAGTRRLENVSAPFVSVQILAVLADIVSIAIPVWASYVRLQGGYTSPLLVGTSSSDAGSVGLAVICWIRWSLALPALAALPLSVRCCHSSLVVDEPRASTPSPSTAPLHPHHTPASTHNSTFSSWAHLTPSAMSSRRPGTGLSGLLTLPETPQGGSISTSPPSQLRMKSASRALPHQPVPLTSFLELGDNRRPAVQSDLGGVDIDETYYHTQTLPATYASSTPDSNDSADVPERNEDLVVPPSPSPVPAGRLRLDRIAPSLPPLSATATRPQHRAHQSLPPLLTSGPPVRPHGPAVQTSSMQSSGVAVDASPTTARSVDSLSGALPRLVHKLSGAFTTDARFTGADSPYRFPRDSTQDTTIGSAASSPDQTRSLAPSLSDELSSAYFSPLASPAPIVTTSSPPRKLRRSSLQRTATPDPISPPVAPYARSHGGGISPTSSVSLAGAGPNRRRSGSVGSLLRSVASVGAIGSISLRDSLTPTPTPTRELTSPSWDVEPNEAEDDPFARPAPPPPASTPAAALEPSAEDGQKQALRLVRALEAIQEPESGSREGSTRSGERESALVSHAEDEYVTSEVERVVTPQPTDYDADFAGRLLSRRPSEVSSIFYEHMDSAPSASSVSSIGSLVRAPLDFSSPSSPLELSSPLIPIPSTPRRRTDKRATSMSPSASAGRKFRQALEIDDESTDEVAVEPKLLFGADSASQSSPLAMREATASFDAMRSPGTVLSDTRTGSPQTSSRVGRARPSALPLNDAFGSSSNSSISTAMRRSPSFMLLPRRTSSNSLFSGPSFALRRLRRRSPSPLETSRISESSDLSFACRGALTSTSDLGAPFSQRNTPAVVPSLSDDGVEAIEKAEAATDSSLPAPRSSQRKPWWKHLATNRPSTPYLRLSPSPLVPHRASTVPSSNGLTRSRSASFGSSAHPTSRSSTDHDAAHVLSHGRSASMPLMSGSLRWSAVQLPPISDVSPFASSIFHRRSGSGDEQQTDPLQSLPASLVNQRLLDIPPTSLHLSPSARSSWRASTYKRSTTPLDTPQELVVRELDDLVGTFAGSLGGSSFEFPERSFERSSDSQSGTGSSGEQEQYVVVGAEAVSASVDSTPTSASDASSAPFTPLTSVFSPISTSSASPRAASAQYAAGLEKEHELMSPLTPASAGFVSPRSPSSGWKVWHDSPDGEDETLKLD